MGGDGTRIGLIRFGWKNLAFVGPIDEEQHG